MTVKVTLAKVTGRHHCLKLSTLKLNKNMELQTPSGSFFDQSITPGSDTWYWFAFDDKQNTIVDMTVAVRGEELASMLITRHRNLIDATTAITDTYSQLNRLQRDYVLQAAGVALTAGWAVFNGVQAVNSLFAWEPINFCISLGMSAATGALTKMQYDKLTDVQKAAVTATKQFKSALTDFHSVIKTYAPENMRGYPMASPAFNGIHNKIYRWLPKMDVESMETNRPNWSCA